jgi:hypothetical protein
MSDRLVARLRTVWPMFVGHVAAWLLVLFSPVVDWLASKDLNVSHETAAVGVGLVLGWVAWEFGTKLERVKGDGWLARRARGVGRLLLTVGKDTGQPTYKGN